MLLRNRVRDLEKTDQIHGGEVAWEGPFYSPHRNLHANVHRKFLESTAANLEKQPLDRYNDVERVCDGRLAELTEQELQKQKDHEEDLQRLRGFRPVDDTFMRVLFRDNLPLAQYVLRVITGKQDLRLTKEETQKDLVRLVGARGLCLDVHGVDDQNQQYDLEVQRADAGARPERARYHAGALDVENLDAGQEFEELPTTYIIFITENDIWGGGQALYPVNKTLGGTNIPFEDRQYILYVNASYKGDDPLGQLMHDFLCSDPDEMKTAILADRARYLKSDPKGVETMCKEMEKMRDDVEQRTVLRDIKNIMEGLKYTAEQAMELLKISAEDQSKYIAKL